MENFMANMRLAIKEHEGTYGDSWKTEPAGYLHNRLKHKLAEYDLTMNPHKLISVANLSMLLFLRMSQR